MNLLDLDHLLRYWTAEQWQANVLMLFHLLGAMVLGLVLGYERAFHGRAAGMRTYALVCMASTGVIILLAYPQQWYGGLQGGSVAPHLSDPTRVIQGIVTGIGFLCAGVIMREGMNISGLTTAASLWAASSIGIMLGMGFYFAAIMLTLLCASLMMWGAKLESHLPSHPAIAVMLRGEPQRKFVQQELAEFCDALGFRFAPGSLSVTLTGGQEEWRFVCTAKHNFGAQTLTRFASRVTEVPGVAEYRVTHARN
ncbi:MULTISPECIES: MgtC/SapB family protein [Roseateles]|uniref:Protein MgtC n=1 Tax=Roseateles albus TaxID=2987525 RepID=A0ABT5KB91_9BURK|nr:MULTISPECIES: MgtC/SapB family protein [Roseateles]MCV2358987.1 MgtC/SapB family protein [Paucibacter sp. TC2R-5]MDC8771143.1 MgtC/SapB family protein [Roseateles albus]